MKWVQNLGLTSLFIKIDFEKAYYQVEWPFILAVLKALGFVVETLFAEASACLSINCCKLEEVGMFKL